VFSIYRNHLVINHPACVIQQIQAAPQQQQLLLQQLPHQHQQHQQHQQQEAPVKAWVVERLEPGRCPCQEPKQTWPYPHSPCYNLNLTFDAFQQTRTLAPSTPLTGRRYLKEKDVTITPVSTATQSVSRLQHLLSGRKTAPSDMLQEQLL